MDNPRSTASVAGHPIHPMLVPFPIAFFVGALVTDLVFWQTGVALWSAASFWLLSAGHVMAALAAVVGLIDVLSEPRIRMLQDAWWHAGGNVLAVLISLYNWYGRYALGRSCRCSTRTDAFAHRSADPFVHGVERLEACLSASGRGFR